MSENAWLGLRDCDEMFATDFSSAVVCAGDAPDVIRLSAPWVSAPIENGPTRDWSCLYMAAPACTDPMNVFIAICDCCAEIVTFRPQAAAATPNAPRASAPSRAADTNFVPIP